MHMCHIAGEATRHGHVMHMQVLAAIGMSRQKPTSCERQARASSERPNSRSILQFYGQLLSRKRAGSTKELATAVPEDGPPSCCSIYLRDHAELGTPHMLIRQSRHRNRLWWARTSVVIQSPEGLCMAKMGMAFCIGFGAGGLCTSWFQSDG